MDDLIVVRGTATRQCPADRGVLTVTARVKKPTAAEAEAALAELSTAADLALDQFAAIIADRTTVHLSIRPNSYWHAETGRTLVDGQFGERSVRLAISDTDRVGELLRSLYDAAAVEVGGPVWELAGDNPIHGEVRHAAAQDARQRAEDYAAGLGLSVGGVAHVTEPGLRTEPPGVMRSLAFAGDSEMSTGPTVDLGTAEISVSASVDVGFRIEPPR